MVKHDPLIQKTNTGTYLGFDFGNKKIGTAVGQTITMTASPLQTIRSINQNPSPVPDSNSLRSSSCHCPGNAWTAHLDTGGTS